MKHLRILLCLALGLLLISERSRTQPFYQRTLQPTALDTELGYPILARGRSSTTPVLLACSYDSAFSHYLHLSFVERDGTVLRSLNYRGAEGILSRDGLAVADGYVLAGSVTVKDPVVKRTLRGGCVVALDPEGNFLWGKVYEECATAFTAIVEAPDGYYLLGPSATSVAGKDDVALLHIDAEGNIIWSILLGTPGSDAAAGLAVARDGGPIIVGRTGASISSNAADIMAVHLSLSGRLLWAKRYGGSDMDDAGAILAAVDSGFLIAALTRSFSPGRAGLLLMKVDEEGTVEWERFYNSLQLNTINRIVADDADNLLIAGDVRSENAGQNLFLLKTGPLGDVLWGRSIGGSGNESLRSIAPSDGGYLLAGETKSFSSTPDILLTQTDALGRPGCLYDTLAFSAQASDELAEEWIDELQMFQAGNAYPFSLAQVDVRMMSGIACSGTSGEAAPALPGTFLRFHALEGLMTLRSFFLGADGNIFVGGERWLPDGSTIESYFINTDSLASPTVYGGIGWDKPSTGVDDPDIRLGHTWPTPDGGVMIAGFHKDEDTYLTVAKMRADGICQWSKRLRKISGLLYASAAPTRDGGAIVAGPGCIVKVDSLGTIEWLQEGKNFPEVRYHKLIQTSDGGYVLAGGIGGNSTTNTTDMLVVKVNSSGETVWSLPLNSRQPKDRGLEQILDLCEARDGSILVCGSIRPRSDMEGMLIGRISSEGEVLWIGNYGGRRLNQGLGIAETADGRILVAGSSFSGLNGAAFICLDSAAGDIVWSKLIPDLGTPAAIAENANGTITVIGFHICAEIPALYILTLDRNGNGVRTTEVPTEIRSVTVTTSDLTFPVWTVDRKGSASTPSRALPQSRNIDLIVDANPCFADQVSEVMVQGADRRERKTSVLAIPNPVPFGRNVRLQLPSSFGNRVRVSAIDVAGRRVPVDVSLQDNRPDNGVEVLISTGELTPGLYILDIRDDYSQVSTMLIVY